MKKKVVEKDIKNLLFDDPSKELPKIKTTNETKIEPHFRNKIFI